MVVNPQYADRREFGMPTQRVTMTKEGDCETQWVVFISK